MASRLSRRPVRVGNSGSSLDPARSLSQTRKRVSAGLVRGTARCFRPFPSQRTLAPGSECDVAAVQAGEFGDPEAGLDGQQHQGPVSPAFPAGLIRRGEQRIDFGGSQEHHDPLVEPFRGDRQHALDEQRVLGVAQGGVGEQRTDRRQAQVPGPGAIAPLVLEVVQECRDRGGVQVVPVELGGHLSGALVHEGEQQAQGVAVRRDGLRAGPTLLDEPVGEECLQRWRDQRHDRAADHAVSCRTAARASSSGAADRYQ